MCLIQDILGSNSKMMPYRCAREETAEEKVAAVQDFRVPHPSDQLLETS